MKLLTVLNLLYLIVITPLAMADNQIILQEGLEESMELARLAIKNKNYDEYQNVVYPYCLMAAITQEEWNEMFNGNIRRGVSVDIKSDGSMTIWVNISHPSLVKYKEKHPDLTMKKLVEKYSNYIGLTTYATYCIKEGKIINYAEDSDAKEMMEATSDAIALFGMLYNDAS